MKQVSDGRTEADVRKRRVQILKKVIIFILAAFILMPTVLCTALFMRVGTLEKQIEDMEALVKELGTGDSQTHREQASANPGFIVDSKEEVKAEDEQEDILKTDGEETDMRKVYLTFDDGPGSQTDEILDVLAEYNVKATFFVNGKTDEASKAAYQRIVEEGHTLAMHSYSHKYSEIYASVEDFAADFTKLQEYLYEVTGVWSRYTRFPGGSSNSVSKVDMKEFIAWLDEQGITYFDWNISSGDAAPGGISAEQIVLNCTQNLKKHQMAMILMHDSAGKKTTAEALPEVIETILAMENTEILPITDDTDTIPVQHIRVQMNE